MCALDAGRLCCSLSFTTCGTAAMMAPVRAADGRPLWRIDVYEERSAVLYVLADSQEDAEADAKELKEQIESYEWDHMENDCVVRRATRPPEPATRVWTGGPEGNDVAWSTLGGESGD